MSDLKDAIASTSVQAFNDGYRWGTKSERERIAQALISRKNNWRKPTSFNYLRELEDIIQEVLNG